MHDCVKFTRARALLQHKADTERAHALRKTQQVELGLLREEDMQQVREECERAKRELAAEHSKAMAALQQQHNAEMVSCMSMYRLRDMRLTISAAPWQLYQHSNAA